LEGGGSRAGTRRRGLEGGGIRRRGGPAGSTVVPGEGRIAMFILFGYRRRSTGQGVVLRECDRCGRMGQHVLVTTTTWLTLFFVPVVPLPRSHRLVCRQCQKKTTVRGQQLAEVEAAIAGAAAPALSYGGAGTAVNTESLSGVATAVGVDPVVSPTPYGTVGAGAALPQLYVGALPGAADVPGRAQASLLDVATQPTPGWYTDPGGDQSARRYWDGARWSTRVRWNGQGWEPT
ncbi:MAG: DUF2510 domain-containing protein, partial [Acidimicrobiales bacterium]